MYLLYICQWRQGQASTI